MPTFNLIERYKNTNTKFVFTSTCEIFNGAVDNELYPVPTDENVPVMFNDITNPRWSYSIPKALGENLIANCGLDWLVLRYFNVYSLDQKADSPYATAVANWMRYIREDKNPFITGDGEQRRDMAHKNDVVSANLFAMEYEGKFAGQHYDVGTGSNISLNEMKDIVNEHFPEVKFD